MNALRSSFEKTGVALRGSFNRSLRRSGLGTTPTVEADDTLGKTEGVTGTKVKTPVERRRRRLSTFLLSGASTSNVEKLLTEAAQEAAGDKDPWKKKNSGSSLNLKKMRKGTGKLELVAASLCTSADMAQTAAEHVSRAFREEEPRAGTAATRLGTLIAEYLERTGKTVEDIFRDWDTKSRGKLSIGEFRVRVRALGFADDHMAVDELFRSFSQDDCLSMRGLKWMIRDLMKQANEVMLAGQRRCEFAARLRSVAALYAVAAEATSAAESAQEMLHSAVEMLAIDACAARGLDLKLLYTA